MNLVSFIAGAGDFVDGRWSLKAVHTLVRSGQVHSLKPKDTEDLWMLPRQSSSRMLVEEVLTSSELPTVELATKVEVPNTFLNGDPDFLGIHLTIIHLAVPDAEGCTGR